MADKKLNYHCESQSDKKQDRHIIFSNFNQRYNRLKTKELMFLWKRIKNKSDNFKCWLRDTPYGIVRLIKEHPQTMEAFC